MLAICEYTYTIVVLCKHLANFDLYQLCLADSKEHCYAFQLRNLFVSLYFRRHLITIFTLQLNKPNFGQGTMSLIVLMSSNTLCFVPPTRANKVLKIRMWQYKISFPIMLIIIPINKNSFPHKKNIKEKQDCSHHHLWGRSKMTQRSL